MCLCSSHSVCRRVVVTMLPSGCPYSPPCTLCLIHVFSCSATWPDAAGPIKPNVDLYFRSYLLFLLGAVHLIFSLWMVVEYFVVNYPNFIFPLPSFFYTAFKRCVHALSVDTCISYAHHLTGVAYRNLNRPTLP